MRGKDPTFIRDLVRGKDPTFIRDLVRGKDPTLIRDLVRGKDPTLVRDLVRGKDPTLIRDLVIGKDPTFNRYSDRLKALRCLTKHEVEETALADVATIESNRPKYGNLREFYDVIRFGPLLETITKKVDYYPFSVQVNKLCLITIKPVIMSLEAFVQNILVPEIVVKYEMKKSNCSYKTASNNLYAGGLPTVYHEKILLYVAF